MSDNYSRIALVTGATSGIGEATAKKFVEAGYGVIGSGRTEEKLKALEAELGDAFRGVSGDSAEDSVIDDFYTASQKYFGSPPDIVVVNAGRGLSGSVQTADLVEFEEVLKINVLGAVKLMQKSARILVEKQERDFPASAADIVVIGSVVGRNISPFSSVYGSSKFAVHSLAEGLRREIGPKGVRVSTVEPGLVLSGFQEVAGYDDAMIENFHEKFDPLLYGKDIADAIYHIVSLPAHVHISDIMVRPTRQDYP